MGCYDCNSPPVATLDNMRNYLNKLIEQGEILSDLRDCQGGKLPPGTKVALCENLEAKIKELVGDSVVNLVSYNQETGTLEVASNKGAIKQQFNLKELVLGTLPKFGNGLKVTYKDNAISAVAVDTGSLLGALQPGDGIDIKAGVISLKEDAIPTPPTVEKGVTFTNILGTEDYGSLLK